MAFGFDQLTVKTPMWATWIFRITILLTTVATFWVSGTGLIADDVKIEVMYGLKGLDMFVWGISKFFGINKESFGLNTNESNGKDN